MKAQSTRIGGQFVARERGAYERPQEPKREREKERERIRPDSYWKPFAEFFARTANA